MESSSSISFSVFMSAVGAFADLGPSVTPCEGSSLIGVAVIVLDIFGVFAVGFGM